jgi:hypothetical protein
MRHWRAAAGTAVVAATQAAADLMAAEAASTVGAEVIMEEAEASTATVPTGEAAPSAVLAEDHLVVRAADRLAAQEVARRLTRG